MRVFCPRQRDEQFDNPQLEAEFSSAGSSTADLDSSPCWVSGASLRARLISLNQMHLQIPANSYKLTSRNSWELREPPRPPPGASAVTH